MDADTKEIGVELLGELRSMVLEENKKIWNCIEPLVSISQVGWWVSYLGTNRVDYN